MKLQKHDNGSKVLTMNFFSTHMVDLPIHIFLKALLVTVLQLECITLQSVRVCLYAYASTRIDLRVSPYAYCSTRLSTRIFYVYRSTRHALRVFIRASYS
jgi:hypothetical protein